MKVLAVASNTFDQRYEEFSRTRSGYGYMVNDIVDSTSKLEDVYLLTHQFTPGYRDDTYTILPHTKADVIKHSKAADIFKGIKACLFFKDPVSIRLRYMYYEIEKGYFRHVIEKLRPDVVHIHGLTLQMKPYVDVCLEKDIPFLVTLHGLNGNVEKVSRNDKDYERAGLLCLAERGVPVTVVSSGIKEEIRSMYGLSGDNIQVILNGTRLEGTPVSRRPHDGYNIVCIGNISTHKNQLQLIRAYRLLPDECQKRVRIHFCGDNPEQLDINAEIGRCRYPQNIVYHGFVERSELDTLWESADLNVVASLVEGFGLSIIEGFSKGVPTLTFSDLSACRDLYDPEAMLCVGARSDESLAEGIQAAAARQWDEKRILAWADSFSLDNVARQYTSVYKRIIGA